MSWGAEMLRIAVEDLREGVSTLEFTCKPEEISLDLDDVNFTSPVDIKLKLFKQGDKIYVKAELSVNIERECDRCLKLVHEVLTGNMEIQYRPTPKMDSLIMDDIGIGYYLGEYIELSDDIRESLMLELPVKVLCSEDCKGFCPKCGQNLNESKCNCHLETKEVRNPKFAELAKLLEAMK
jgi:uncharacterized protein